MAESVSSAAGGAKRHKSSEQGWIVRLVLTRSGQGDDDDGHDTDWEFIIMLQICSMVCMWIHLLPQGPSLLRGSSHGDIRRQSNVYSRGSRSTTTSWLS